MAKNNPNKVNQYTEPDPRQSLYLSYYLDPTSETFSNSLQSALKAGYSQEYAESLTAQMPDWLSESLGDNKMLQKAVKVLEETLDMDDTEAIVVEGEEVDRKRNPALTKIKQDSAKFVAETVGKAKYSKRTEQTGPNGKELPTPLLVKIIGNESKDNGDTD